MSDKPRNQYRKLTRMHRGLGAMTQLWLGPDHLLHVISTGYTESYRRFYLRDIQAMLIMHTGRRAYWALTLIIVAVIVLSTMNMADAGATALVVVGAIFAVLLAWNHLRGPGCAVVIVTAVQQETVTALSRLPRTRKVLLTLQETITAAQADLVAPPGSVEVPPAMPGGSVPPLPPPLPVS